MPSHTTKLDPKPMPKLTLRDTKTFVEVLYIAKPLRKTVVYETIPDDKEWLLKSLAVGCRFLGASQAIITFTDKESMEKELKEVCSVLKNSFIRFKSWEQKVKAIDMFGCPFWDYLLIGVKELLNTTSFMTLCEQMSLILDGDEYEILVNELKPDFSPLFATIKHSMDASGTCISDEESCSENTNSEGYKW
ncbi:hypothetical protein POTOM_025699 [Populus tomentosa]|uniref:Uncharacterized protein n=1 Tax=Populus tomentosa TaxID=118781 RepID=A0A8X8CXL2_POPTO|nr:hypothetical protein POTOM_025699 [Populus tomentosa]